MTRPRDRSVLKDVVPRRRESDGRKAALMAASEETVSGSLGLLLGLSGALLQGAKREAEGEKLQHLHHNFNIFTRFMAHFAEKKPMI